MALSDVIAECIYSALPTRRDQRIVISGAMFAEMTALVNEYHDDDEQIDPETIDPDTVRVYGLPIRIDDAATAPYVEEIE